MSLGSPADEARLLEGALGYALGCVVAVGPASLPRPTPCSDWDLGMLLRHVNDSLAVLHEGMETGCVSADATANETDDAASGLVAAFRDRARRLLGTWAAMGGREDTVAVADLRLRAGIVAVTGAIEIAVHGWDISRACGRREPIPPALAAGLLEMVPMVVTTATRGFLFAAPVAVPPLADAGDRLVAFLGRDPRA